MSKTTHTPGPWTLEESVAGATAIVGGNVVIASLPSWPAESDEQAANSRLIAAAPEMADALRAIVALAEDHGRMNLPECAGLARSALAKAEVRS